MYLPPYTQLCEYVLYIKSHLPTYLFKYNSAQYTIHNLQLSRILFQRYSRKLYPDVFLTKISTMNSLYFKKVITIFLKSNHGTIKFWNSTLFGVHSGEFGVQQMPAIPKWASVKNNNGQLRRCSLRSCDKSLAFLQSILVRALRFNQCLRYL